LYSNGKKYIVKSSYLENGKEVYDVYTPGKKNINAYQFTMREDNIDKIEKTQKEKVAEAVKGEAKTIKQIAEETKILEPNVRRILGVGAKEGVFERVEKGVYVLSKGGQDVAFIETASAVDSLPKLAESGFKADMIFLDIPYDTPAVKGGNRGVKYNLLSVEDFGKVLDATNKILRNENSPVFYMYSKAASGIKKMMKYNELLAKKGLKVIAEGNYTKYQKDGITRVRNMRGNIIEPEGLILLNKSGKFNIEGLKMDFDLIRPKGYQTEKPADMLDALILKGTKVGDMILDPFAGSGVTLAEAVRLGRKAYGIEVSEKAVEEYIKPKVKEALKETSEESVYLNDLKNQIGDVFDTVKPVGTLWKNKGNVIFIKFKKHQQGEIAKLKQNPIIENVQEAGGDNVLKVVFKKTKSQEK